VWRCTPEFPPQTRKLTWIDNCPVWRSSGAAHGFRVVEAARETGSGLHGRRQALLRILRHPKVQVIVVEHRDRLMRFGFAYLEAALAAQGRRLVVLDGAEITDDMVRDLYEVIVCMCARLYGKRAAKKRAKKAIEAMPCASC
jgi:putative resolvase